MPRPRKLAKLGTLPPRAAALLVASLAFVTGAPQISFLENPKLRNYEIALTQGRGLWPCPRKSAKLGASPSHSAAVFRGFVGFHSRRASNRFSGICEIALTQGRGLWPRPQKSATLGTFPPHSASLFMAPLAFLADAPRISFLEIAKIC